MGTLFYSNDYRNTNRSDQLMHVLSNVTDVDHQKCHVNLPHSFGHLMRL